MGELDRKLEELKHFIADKGKNGVVIAFSGGVDSTTLAMICLQVLGNKAVAVIAHSPIHTAEEIREAKILAHQIGIQLYVTLTSELENEDFVKNFENRCYYCKKELLQKLLLFGRDHDLAVVFEGTNITDLSDHRPGFQAVQETEGVYSPWVACKFGKDEIRQTAKNLGLSVFDKIAHPCLATRIPYNDRVTAERLKRVEAAERVIQKIVDAKILRVRDNEGIARIEVGQTERNLFFNVAVLDAVALELKKLGFKHVTFDLEGYRKGSMLNDI
jgi:uncharacterized protein